MKKELKVVFAKVGDELLPVVEWLLKEVQSLPETRLSTTDKAMTFSTEVAYGFARGNSRSVELNLFVPLNLTLDAKWKESRHTSLKKLATTRLSSLKDCDDDLRNLIEEAHRLSSRPRHIDTNTKEGFLVAVKALRQSRKRVQEPSLQMTLLEEDDEN